MQHFYFPSLSNARLQTVRCQWALMQIASQQKPLHHYTLICSQAGFQLVPCPWTIIHCQGTLQECTSYSLNRKEEGKQSYVTDSQKSLPWLPRFLLGSGTDNHVSRIRRSPLGKLMKYMIFSLVKHLFSFGPAFYHVSSWTWPFQNLFQLPSLDKDSIY